MGQLDASCFDLIEEKKKRKRLEWEDIAEKVNERNGTNITSEQCRELVKRRVFPFGAWLTLAIEDVLEIGERDPKTRISFKGGGGNGD